LAGADAKDQLVSPEFMRYDPSVTFEKVRPRTVGAVAAEFTTAFRQFWEGYFKGPRGC